MMETYNFEEDLNVKDLERCELELSKDIERYERMGKKKRRKIYNPEQIDLIYEEFNDVKGLINILINEIII